MDSNHKEIKARKKTSMKIKSRLVLISAVVILIVIFASVTWLLSLTSCSNDSSKIEEKVQEVLKKGPSEVKDAIVCKNIDSNYAPIDPTDIFPSGTNEIHISIKFKNFTNKDSLKVVWKYIETGEDISTQEFSPKESGSGYHSFNIKFAEGFPSGRYNVKLYFNGNLYKSSDFTVQ
jgi:hypothetical protein